MLPIVRRPSLAFILAGIVFANLRFFIWLGIIGMVNWGISMLVTGRGDTAEAGGWAGRAVTTRQVRHKDRWTASRQRIALGSGLARRLYDCVNTD